MAFSSSIEKVFEKAYLDICRECVEKLSKKYDFSVDDGMRVVTGEEVVKSKIVLPFVGDIDEEKCMGIKFNNGLHTQCDGDKGEGVYCKKCEKECDKNANGKPNVGDIRDRLKCGLLDYVDEKGRKTQSYMKVITKQGVSREEAEKNALTFGIRIPEEHWKCEEKKRGRPKKEKTEKTEKTTEKKRGRPKKEKRIEAAVEDDLMAALKAVEEECDEVCVSKFVFDGVEYLKSDDNVVYDSKTHDIVGHWNEEEQKMDEVEVVDEE